MDQRLRYSDLPLDLEFEAVRGKWDDAELANLPLALATINAWNRLAIASRPQRYRQSAVAHSDDGGKVAVNA